LGLLTWIRDFLGGETVTAKEVTEEEFFNLFAEIQIRELAFWSAVNMIANSISKCEFKTFIGNKEVQEREYYLWNYEPNKNQNSSAFLQKLVTQLYRNHECLVIDQNGQLLVADSFQKWEFALRDNLFTEVTVNDFTFNKTFNMSEVMYYQLPGKDVRKIINAIYETYGKLIAYGMKSYQRSKGSRGILDYQTIAPGDSAAQKTFDDLMNNRFKKFFEANNAVLPLPKGYTFTDIGSKTYSEATTRDIRAMVDDIFDFTARGFGIPPALLKGDVAGLGDAIDLYLTVCIDPLTDMLAEEANRKRSGYEGFKAGIYLEIETRTIKHIDVLSISAAIDKLVSSGCYSINEIRKLTGESVIDELWASQHFITKNYSTVEDLLAELKSEESKGGKGKGGKNSGEDKEIWTINERRIDQGLKPIPGGDAIYIPSSNIPAVEFEEKDEV
jgi:HK97 family phage portal protein